MNPKAKSDKYVKVNPRTLDLLAEAHGGSVRQLGTEAAKHLLPDGFGEAALISAEGSLRTTINQVRRATSPRYTARARATAIAAALGVSDVRDLAEPILFGLERADGELVSRGGMTVMATTSERAWRTIGVLVGACNCLSPGAAEARPVRLMFSDRVRRMGVDYEREGRALIDLTDRATVQLGGTCAQTKTSGPAGGER